ncbi:aspartyl protease family protein [Spirosoma sp. KNUC1025]|uniref:aspartyl protease family protein n=1 Tax=Spirosoma sp. KNUC1025 TaxID=2894082 RepID=UPI003863024A|nr:aspartyl protease family protein [Spirosoma sp. KNUC1025]
MLTSLSQILAAFSFGYIFLAGYTASAQKIRQHIPITVSENTVYVNVHVNGHGPYNFMFDSGMAGMGRVGSRLAKELGLKIVGFEENTEGTTVKREFLVAIDKLGIAQIAQSNLKLVVRDYTLSPKQIPVDGVIGRDFFYNYLLTIDGPGRQLVVSKDVLNAQDKGVLPYNKPFLVTGKVANTAMMFSLDTGSDFRLNFPKASLMGVHYANTPNQRVVTQANRTYVLQEAILGDELVLGSIRVKDQHVHYSDKTHQINVGEAFLKEHTVTFDQRNRLVRID